MHVGTIRQLEFSHEPLGTAASHLFSSSDDGCIAIWRRNARLGSKGGTAVGPSWECIRVLRRHKGPVTSIAIHPSNRCAFSLSEDKTLRVWNLLRGRQAYATRLKTVADGAEAVRLSSSGERMLFIWPNRFEVIDLSATTSVSETQDAACLGKLIGSVHFPQAHSASPVFFSEDDHEAVDQPKWVYLLAGLGRNLCAFRCPLASSSVSSKPTGVENCGEVLLPGKRVKFIHVSAWAPSVGQAAFPFGPRSRLVTLVTTESDGSYLRGYAVDFSEHSRLEMDLSVFVLFTYDLNSVRITSLAAGWFDAVDEVDGETAAVATAAESSVGIMDTSD